MSKTFVCICKYGEMDKMMTNMCQLVNELRTRDRNHVHFAHVSRKLASMPDANECIASVID